MFCPFLDLLVSRSVLLLHPEQKQIILSDYFEVFFMTSQKSFWKLSFNQIISLPGSIMISTDAIHIHVDNIKIGSGMVGRYNI